jgi:AmiR/NasT family two-component response regulator
MSKQEKRRSPHAAARLLVIDANAVYREGVRAIIARADRFELCDDLPKDESPAHLVERHKPDLVLIEPFEEERDGVLLIKEGAPSCCLAETGGGLCRANSARWGQRLLDEERRERRTNP